jgi:6-phosphogluconate dehydrogenase (decarboxylating)
VFTKLKVGILYACVCVSGGRDGADWDVCVCVGGGGEAWVKTGSSVANNGTCTNY